MPNRRLHLVCYDIADPGRLKAALDLSRHYATGGQKSVHECWLTARERSELLQRLEQMIDVRDDRVLLVALDPRRHVVTLGIARSPTNHHLIVIEA